MRLRFVGCAVITAMVVVACSHQPVALQQPHPTVSDQALPAVTAPEANASATQSTYEATDSTANDSTARSTQTASPLLYETSSADYRRDAARHIYKRLSERIYKGKLPPMLKAVVVVDIHIEPSGQVGHIDWVRLPKHAPEVQQDIEQAIIQAAPFPAPAHFKRVRYTETWLWHKSGRFQLDTLTEGQY